VRIPTVDRLPLSVVGLLPGIRGGGRGRCGGRGRALSGRMGSAWVVSLGFGSGVGLAVVLIVVSLVGLLSAVAFLSAVPLVSVVELISFLTPVVKKKCYSQCNSYLKHIQQSIQIYMHLIILL
jgi:hypothetical protein